MSALPRNLVAFVRLLRRGGVRCGPGASVDALRAVEAVGLSRRDDFFWALHAVLVTRREDHEVFRRAFETFWRVPPREGDPIALPGTPTLPPPPPRPGTRRVRPERSADALGALRPHPPAADPEVLVAWSDQEVIRHRDFEQMSAEETALAWKVIAEMRPRIPRRRTRRLERDSRRGRVDLRRTLRASLRSGHGSVPLERSRHDTGPLDLVLLCDISGSMDRYARVVLHFAHALTATSGRVHTFVFGTRVTNVTRQLRSRDVDLALEAVGRAAGDWSGGTRIGQCLASFNLRWARRILARGAVVLLFTDGLDRDGAQGITREAARLRRSCRKLVWLNPLLRYEGFEPKAAGIRSLLGEVDEHRPIHDLESLDQLAGALARF